MKTMLTWAALPAMVLALAACGGEGGTDADGTLNPSGRTLAQSLGEFDQLGAVVDNAELRQVLEGVGPYTLFAPVDDAFQAARLNDALDGDETAAQGAALVREHMAPGVVTRADIRAAIAASEDGSVQMRTLGEGTLTFREQDGVLYVRDGDREARLTGEEDLASNGVIQPIDALLLTPDPGEEEPEG
jgi:uncharacterized surface protein with fasciclin (FAS1) repeats